MRAVYLAVGGMAIVGGVIVAVQWSHSSPASETSRHAGTDLEMPELADSHEEASSGTSEEVGRLRAELRQKDAILRSLLTATSKNAASMPAQPVVAPQMPEMDPATRAIDLLDERMFTAPSDPGKAAEMERALRDVANSPALGEAKVASLYCGSTLCKVTLTAESEVIVNQSMAAMSSHLPKAFGASVVVQPRGGPSAMYLANSSQDLAIEPRNADKRDLHSTGSP
jgi:hypothetical protein